MPRRGGGSEGIVSEVVGRMPRGPRGRRAREGGRVVQTLDVSGSAGRTLESFRTP